MASHDVSFRCNHGRVRAGQTFYLCQSSFGKSFSYKNYIVEQSRANIFELFFMFVIGMVQV